MGSTCRSSPAIVSAERDEPTRLVEELPDDREPAVLAEGRRQPRSDHVR